MNEAQLYDLVKRSLRDPIFGDKNSTTEGKPGERRANPSAKNDTALKGEK